MTTLNPSDIASSLTLSNGNLTCASAVTNTRGVRATTAKTSGKWYFEATLDVISGSGLHIGVCASSVSLTAIDSNDSLTMYTSSGAVYSAGTTIASLVATAAQGDVIGVAIDTAAGLGWFSKNGTWMFGDPETGKQGIPIKTIPGGGFYPILLFRSVSTASVKFSSTTYAPPAGFLAWDTTPKTLSGPNGSVVDDTGAAAVRTLVAIRRSNGALAGVANSNSSGALSISTPFSDEHVVIALDDAAGTQYNALVLDRVTPV